VVECQLPKLDVAGSIPVARSTFLDILPLWLSVSITVPPRRCGRCRLGGPIERILAAAA
jgi:hypothetical protein